MKLKGDARLVSEQGNFGVVLDDRELHVSLPLFQLSQRLGTRTAESLYESAVEQPTLFATALNWPQDAVLKATADLKSTISAYRPGYFQRELVSMEELGLGALPPAVKAPRAR